jgi:hypothetical protein
MPKKKWAKAEVELVREVAREAEVYLQGQLTLATSADQRAAVLAGIYIAAGTAIIAGIIAASPSLTLALAVGGLVAAGMFLAGATLCIITCLPAGFSIPGNQPESWDDDVEDNTPIRDALGEAADIAQDQISENRAFLRKNAKRFRLGALLGASSPLVGLVLWFLLWVKWPVAGG